MKPKALRALIADLPEHQPITLWFETAIGYRPNYPSQKHHWLGWLGEYDGPGFYSRTVRPRSAEFCYNHVQCPPMILWLVEACGSQEARFAADRALKSKPHHATRCSVIRAVVPFSSVLSRLTA